MPHYVEDFTAAMTALTGDGHIKQRLITVFDEHLGELEVSDLPLTVRESFADLRFSVTQVEPLNGEGPIRASVRKMSIAEASRCAQRLVSLYADIVKSDAEPKERESIRAAAQPRMSVPPMLLKSV